MGKGSIAVVGGGLAGLMATLKIVEAGLSVDLFSLVPFKRSHSACAQGGINAALNTKGEGDSIDEHFDHLRWRLFGEPAAGTRHVRSRPKNRQHV